MGAEEALRSKEKREEKNLWRRILFGHHLITVMSYNVSIIFLACIAYLYNELPLFCIFILIAAAIVPKNLRISRARACAP